MARKKSPFRDVQKDLREHERMTALAHTYAVSAVEYEEAGKHKRAQEARSKCRYWLARCLKLEEHYRPKGPK